LDVVDSILSLPVRRLANLFWIGICRQEEERHIHAEGHAFTAWWVHNGIEFQEGTKHHTWQDWAEMRGLNYGKKRSIEDVLDELDQRWETAFLGRRESGER
jgi:hypothetical protein